jgi:UPF0755 protein
VRRRRIVLAVVAVVVLLLVAATAWLGLEANPIGSPGRSVEVDVTQGESTGAVLDQLAARGVIGSALAFRLADVVLGTPVIRPGGYLFRTNQSFGTVRGILSNGPDVFPVTVYPGYTLQEVAHEVDDIPGHTASGFVTAARSGAVHSPWQSPGPADLEGLLGPGTYQVAPGETDDQLLAKMVDRFDTQAAAAGLTTASAAALGLTPYQMVTVASIVQKEGYYPVNMPQVSRVVHNRLSQGIPLQMDSTVLYSLGQDGGPVTPADLKLDTPYNTYLHTGLPPTPICFPSATAVRAAVDPPPGNWLYFVVVTKSGREAFSDTYAGQLANEALARSRGLG